jgi:hypothetical protein
MRGLRLAGLALPDPQRLVAGRLLQPARTRSPAPYKSTNPSFDLQLRFRLVHRLAKPSSKAGAMWVGELKEGPDGLFRCGCDVGWAAACLCVLPRPSCLLLALPPALALTLHQACHPSPFPALALPYLQLQATGQREAGAAGHALSAGGARAGRVGAAARGAAAGWVGTEDQARAHSHVTAACDHCCLYLLSPCIKHPSGWWRRQLAGAAASMLMPELAPAKAARTCCLLLIHEHQW